MLAGLELVGSLGDIPMLKELQYLLKMHCCQLSYSVIKLWPGRKGVYKHKECTEVIGRISLFCGMGSSIYTTLVELGELGRLSASMKKLQKELKNTDKYKNEQYRVKLQESNERSLALIKAGMDIVVAVGLLQLAPKKVTPRVTGAFGFVTSLISCYQLLPSPQKAKTP